MIKLITPLDQLDTSDKYAVGTRYMDKNGNDYVYLAGAASTNKYDWVTYNVSTGSVTRLATTENIGPVAIAMGTIVAKNYGWFQIAGYGIGGVGAATSAGSVLFSSGTAGLAGGSVATGEMIVNAFAVTAGGGSGTMSVRIMYPFSTGTLPSLSN